MQNQDVVPVQVLTHVKTLINHEREKHFHEIPHPWRYKMFCIPNQKPYILSDNTDIHKNAWLGTLVKFVTNSCISPKT